MGEYAKHNGQEIKIGTCESMYYLRHEDRNKVQPLDGNVNPANEAGLFFRLPFPDEDAVQIGNYKTYNRGERLYKIIDGRHEDFSDKTTIEDTGLIQFSNESGMLLNVKCYHGEQLPQNTDDVKFHWNGRSWFYELAFVKQTQDGVFPIVRCRHCSQMWRFSWSEILPFIPNQELRKRLEAHTQEVMV